MQTKEEKAAAVRYRAALGKYRKQIVAALEQQKRYTPSLDITINSCAEQMILASKAMASIMLNGVIQQTKDSFGEKLISNPAVAVVVKAAEQKAKFLKMLGLISKETTTEDKGDDLSDFDNALE